MIAVLHLGEFDGTEFDMRLWSRVPDVVYARHGGDGPLGVVLSQRPKFRSQAYVYVSAQGDEYHYTLKDGEADQALTVERILSEPVAA